MRILVYGQSWVSIRVKLALADINAEVVAISASKINRETSEWLYGLRDISLAIVDAGEPGAEALCRHFEQIRDLVLVLLIDESLADWERLSQCRAAAFIAHSVGQPEFGSRLKKVLPEGSEKVC